jgi:molybdopterin molybdotransferase
MAISTGGFVPDGADAVVPVELVHEDGQGLHVRETVVPGANVRPRGGDAGAGEAVLGAGTFLGPAQVGALAAAGVSEVRCAKRPRVGILVTGSELRPPGQPLAPGEIYESNGLLLAAACQAAGAVPAQLGTVADDSSQLEREMERALLGFDMLVTSGGASVGAHDLVRATFPGFRIEEIFWGVRVKPGKPVCFAMRRDHPIFVLPGNPVSVLVTFELFVRPAINALLGLPDPLPAYSRGVLAAPVTRNPHREEFVRARTRREGDGVVLDPLAGQDSHMIVRAGRADALVAIGAGEGELPAGAEARYLPL